MTSPELMERLRAMWNSPPSMPRPTAAAHAKAETAPKRSAVPDNPSEQESTWWPLVCPHCRSGHLIDGQTRLWCQRCERAAYWYGEHWLSRSAHELMLDAEDWPRDSVDISPCPVCGSADVWWDALNRPRCKVCDAAAWHKSQESTGVCHAFRLRALARSDNHEPVDPPSPYGRKCRYGSSSLYRVPIHDGQAIRCDCA